MQHLILPQFFPKVHLFVPQVNQSVFSACFHQGRVFLRIVRRGLKQYLLHKQLFSQLCLDPSSRQRKEVLVCHSLEGFLGESLLNSESFSNFHYSQLANSLSSRCFTLSRSNSPPLIKLSLNHEHACCQNHLVHIQLLVLFSSLTICSFFLHSSFFELDPDCPGILNLLICFNELTSSETFCFSIHRKQACRLRLC